MSVTIWLGRIFLYEYWDKGEKERTVKKGGVLRGRLLLRRGCNDVDGVEWNFSLGSVKKNYGRQRLNKRNLPYIYSKYYLAILVNSFQYQ